MKKYEILGMSCAACAARVEKAVGSLKNVDNCSVNLLTNSMSVEGSFSDDEIIRAVEKAGYRVKPDAEKPQKKESRGITLRLIFSAALLVLLMYIAMGHNMLSLPLPKIMADNPHMNAAIQLALSLAVMIINKRFFISGIKAVYSRSPNMDTLVALGSLASFSFSVFKTAEIFISFSDGNVLKANQVLRGLYFEAAAMILVIITLGKLLEAYSKGKTTDAIKGLLNLAPEYATVLRDNKELKILASTVKIGDIFLVRPGESIPIDGVITEGFTDIDESALTGESLPAVKKKGDFVYTGTINCSGFVKCEAVSTYEDTSLARIVELVRDAAASKAPIGRIADRVAGVFVPIVLGVALITFIVWMLINKNIGYSLVRAVSVLLISCPCALGLATPVAVMVGSGRGAKLGLLYKNAAVLEKTARVTMVAFDKTGTLTKGTPQVTDICPNLVSEAELLALACSIEALSEHPLAKAVVKKAEERGINPYSVDNFKAVAGGGVSAALNGEPLYGGSLEFISKKAVLSEDIKSLADLLSKSGKTPMFFVKGQSVLGIIATADTVRTEAKSTVAELHAMGIDCAMLTGDNAAAARLTAQKIGIKKVFAGLLPEDKSKIIEELRRDKTVLMVGDGINDAVALSKADIGMAVAKASDACKNAADIVLINNNIKNIASAIRLSKKTLKTIKLNLFWAFFYNVLCIPLAAGAFVGIAPQITISPMFAAACMSLSDICVVTSALSLNFVKITDKKEKRKMEKTLIIEGMMCPHCENRVKALLEGINGVESAAVSHKEGKATLKLSRDINQEIFKSVIENAGYKLLRIN